MTVLPLGRVVEAYNEALGPAARAGTSLDPGGRGAGSAWRRRAGRSTGRGSSHRALGGENGHTLRLLQTKTSGRHGEAATSCLARYAAATAFRRARSTPRA